MWNCSTLAKGRLAWGTGGLNLRIGVVTLTADRGKRTNNLAQEIQSLAILNYGSHGVLSGRSSQIRQKERT